MKKSLKFISISHHTASLDQRECFHLTQIQQCEWFGLLRKRFPDISGLMILSTCNRTEVYLESKETAGNEILNFFVNNQGSHEAEKKTRLFKTGNSTMETLTHLLEVGNGLQSAVIGDSEIMGQLKQAWRQSIQLKAQGSLLERAMQAVFRTHKRVVNETDFHKGTQSTAYKALKFVSEEFGRVELKNKKMLLIGAGEIILNLIKYLPKFNFMEVAIANRTAEKANKIARQNKLSTYEWEKVEANDFEDFDIIISAVSNRSKLVQHTGRLQGKKVLIDMAVPANIDPKLATSPNIRLFGLDDLTASLSDKKTEKQISIAQVQKLIREETNDFSVWLKKKAVREFLTKCQQTQKTRSRYSPSYPDLPQGLSPKDFELLVNRINEQVVKETAGVAQHAKPDELSVQNMSCIIEVFTNQQNQHEENRSFNC